MARFKTTRANDGIRFAMIDPEKILIDHAYQRYPQMGQVLRIAEYFSWAAFQTIAVVPRGNKFACPDGQARLLAFGARFPGYRDDDGKKILIPAMIVPANSTEEEALYFVLLNQEKRRVSSSAIFHAKLCAKHPVELEIMDTTRMFGIVLETANRGRGRPSRDHCRNAGTLRISYDRLGSARFTFLVEFLASFRKPERDNVESGALKATFITGATEFILSTELSNEEIRTAMELDHWTSAEILDKANNSPRSTSYWKRQTVIARIIEDVIRRTGNIAA